MIELRVPSQLSCLQAMGQIAHNQAAHQHAWRFCGLLQHKNKWDKSPAPKSEVSSFCQAALSWKSVICRHRNPNHPKLENLPVTVVTEQVPNTWHLHTFTTFYHPDHSSARFNWAMKPWHKISRASNSQECHWPRKRRKEWWAGLDQEP